MTINVHLIEDILVGEAIEFLNNLKMILTYCFYFYVRGDVERFRLETLMDLLVILIIFLLCRTLLSLFTCGLFFNLFNVIVFNFYQIFLFFVGAELKLIIQLLYFQSIRVRFEHSDSLICILNFWDCEYVCPISYCLMCVVYHEHVELLEDFLIDFRFSLLEGRDDFLAQVD